MIHISVMLFVGLHSSSKTADAILIFGNKVEETGDPSPRLQSRLDEGLRLYQEGQSEMIIVSGGFGKEGFDEAAVMKNYLTEKGVPPENIIEDPEGNNTHATAKNLKQIAKEQNINSIIVVTQYYHMLRAKLALSGFGFQMLDSSYAKMFPELRDLYSIPREILGYYVYLFKN